MPDMRWIFVYISPGLDPAVLEERKAPLGPVTIAWFCALCALAVWTSRRWFIVGVAYFVVTNLAPTWFRAGYSAAGHPCAAGGGLE
jgi:hypothetical protein